jgi:hypothetical protein
MGVCGKREVPGGYRKRVEVSGDSMVYEDLDEAGTARGGQAPLAAPTVTRALVATGADVLSIAQSRPTLADVYLQLVADTAGGPQ